MNGRQRRHLSSRRLSDPSADCDEGIQVVGNSDGMHVISLI